MQKLFAGMSLVVLTIAGGIVGCDFPSIADKLPVKDAPSAAPESKASSASSFSALENSINQQVNQYRQSKNLPPLKLDTRISEQARVHSQAMASGRVPFSHDGFDQRAKAIRRTISYRGVAENVAYNQGYSNPTKQAVQGWIKSTGHRINMEGSYNLTGVGVARNAKGEYYFTQIFVRSR